MRNEDKRRKKRNRNPGSDSNGPRIYLLVMKAILLWYVLYRYGSTDFNSHPLSSGKRRKLKKDKINKTKKRKTRKLLVAWSNEERDTMLRVSWKTI